MRNQAALRAPAQVVFPVCSVTAFFNQFLDVSKVLLHLLAQISQDLNQVIGGPERLQLVRTVFVLDLQRS